MLPNLVPGGPGAAADSAAVSAAPTRTPARRRHVPITPANRPDNAILTLSTNAAEDGLHVKALNKPLPFNVHGGIVSNSNIAVTNGTLKSDRAVRAHTGCSGTIVSTPPPVCTGAPPRTTPTTAPATTTVPAYQPVPANTAASCPAGVVTFQPGYYDDAAALSSLMSGNGACKGSVWWFTPGHLLLRLPELGGSHPGSAARTLADQGRPADRRHPTDGAGRRCARPQRRRPFPARA